MEFSFCESLAEVPPEQWRPFTGHDRNPFLDHAFLSGLERHGCLGEKWGWLPQHILVRDGGRPVAAAPMYIKYNSYGEFVFDWSWADAYARAGLDYYPKLVVGVPYTPASGPRLLTDPSDTEVGRLKECLVQAAIGRARALNASSVHWLFTDAEDTAYLGSRDLPQRTGCQFHWSNPGYRDFEDFLATLSSEKRKKIRRERRRVSEAGIEVERLDGYTATAFHWDIFHDFYRATFLRHGGYATLTRDFFVHLGASMPDRIVLLLAKKGGSYVAGALSLRSDSVLYGRHWGCAADFHSLHFELCYYAGMDYCIEAGLRRFEPGAQGEHKVSRGFEPRQTWSSHWLAHSAFAQAVRGFTEHERVLIADYMKELEGHLPFRQAGGSA